MEKFEIAGLTVEFETGDGLLLKRSRPYLTSDDKKTDIKIKLDDDFFMRRRQSYPMLTLDECRYVWTGEAFYLKLLEFNGFMLHSSCVCRGGNAYLFSARSGTGKSTHTHLWLSEFPDAYILNDDKPAIIINESGAVAYGTPFSGKNDESRNAAAPIRAIVFIERSQKNSIEKNKSGECRAAVYVTDRAPENTAVYGCAVIAARRSFKRGAGLFAQMQYGSVGGARVV
ncbi:MAG: hypothetical protein ACLSE9_02480 [Acutalibacteraceae bacterium]